MRALGVDLLADTMEPGVLDRAMPTVDCDASHFSSAIGHSPAVGPAGRTIEHGCVDGVATGDEEEDARGAAKDAAEARRRRA